MPKKQTGMDAAIMGAVIGGVVGMLGIGYLFSSPLIGALAGALIGFRAFHDNETDKKGPPPKKR